MTTRTPREKITPFVYVMGDAAKTPVDPKAQPVGTVLVFVSEWGQETPAVKGKTVTKDKAARDASLAAAKAQPAGYEG